jgi:hypothetical protein
MRKTEREREREREREGGEDERAWLPDDHNKRRNVTVVVVVVTRTFKMVLMHDLNENKHFISLLS